MFIAIVTYRKPLEEVDRFLQAHRDFLDERYAAGDLIMSGPQTPREGGVILLRGDSREEVETIISHDPFYINGIADYRIVQFTPTKFSSDRLRQELK